MPTLHLRSKKSAVFKPATTTSAQPKPYISGALKFVEGEEQRAKALEVAATWRRKFAADTSWKDTVSRIQRFADEDHLREQHTRPPQRVPASRQPMLDSSYVGVDGQDTPLVREQSDEQLTPRALVREQRDEELTPRALAREQSGEQSTPHALADLQLSSTPLGSSFGPGGFWESLSPQPPLAGASAAVVNTSITELVPEPESPPPYVPREPEEQAAYERVKSEVDNAALRLCVKRLERDPEFKRLHSSSGQLALKASMMKPSEALAATQTTLEAHQIALQDHVDPNLPAMLYHLAHDEAAIARKYCIPIATALLRGVDVWLKIDEKNAQISTLLDTQRELLKSHRSRRNSAGCKISPEVLQLVWATQLLEHAEEEVLRRGELSSADSDLDAGCDYGSFVKRLGGEGGLLSRCVKAGGEEETEREKQKDEEEVRNGEEEKEKEERQAQDEERGEKERKCETKGEQEDTEHDFNTWFMNQVRIKTKHYDATSCHWRIMRGQPHKALSTADKTGQSRRRTIVSPTTSAPYANSNRSTATLLSKPIATKSARRPRNRSAHVSGDQGADTTRGNGGRSRSRSKVKIAASLLRNTKSSDVPPVPPLPPLPQLPPVPPVPEIYRAKNPGQALAGAASGPPPPPLRRVVAGLVASLPRVSGAPDIPLPRAPPRSGASRPHPVPRVHQPDTPGLRVAGVPPLPRIPRVFPLPGVPPVPPVPRSGVPRPHRVPRSPRPDRPSVPSVPGVRPLPRIPRVFPLPGLSRTPPAPPPLTSKPLPLLPRSPAIKPPRFTSSPPASPYEFPSQSASPSESSSPSSTATATPTPAPTRIPTPVVNPLHRSNAVKSTKRRALTTLTFHNEKNKHRTSEEHAQSSYPTRSSPVTPLTPFERTLRHRGPTMSDLDSWSAELKAVERRAKAAARRSPGGTGAGAGAGAGAGVGADPDKDAWITELSRMQAMERERQLNVLRRLGGPGSFGGGGASAS